MFSFTIHGIAPDPNAHHHRVSRSVGSPPVHRAAGGLAEPRAMARADSLGGLQDRWFAEDQVAISPFYDEGTDDFVLPTGRSWRRVFVRFFGLLLMGAALYASFTVLREPETRARAFSWITMGHEAEVRNVAHRVASAFERVRGEDGGSWLPSPKE